MCDCLKCQLPTASENVLMCSGLCKGVAHFKCVGLRKPAFDLISNSDNIHWFCDSCKTLYAFYMDRLKKLVDFSVESIAEDIISKKPIVSAIVPKNSESCFGKENLTPTVSAALQPMTACDQSNIDIINTSLHALQPKSDAISEESYSIKESCSMIGNKTFAEVVSGCTNERPVNQRYDSQLQSTKLICGTRQFAENFGVKTTVPLLWVHLSKFDLGTTEKDITSMVQTCLGIKKFSIFKLIPKNRVLESLEYVCYKLGVNNDLRRKVFDPDTWPLGVHIREFYSKNFRSTLPQDRTL